MRTYSSAQVDQAVWALWMRGYDLHELLWDATLPWPPRERAIRAMGVPFAEYLQGRATGPEETGFLMWWDLVQEESWFESPEEDRARVRQAYLETLRRILDLEGWECQQSASHGLGHLNHPDRPAVVQAFMDAHPEFDADSYERRWFAACRDGTVP